MNTALGVGAMGMSSTKAKFAIFVEEQAMTHCAGHCRQGRAPCPTPNECDDETPVDWVGLALIGLTFGFVALTVWAVLQ